MKSKMLGGILLVVGTTIGVGMLALPVATAQLGFWGSLVLLIVCWAIMTLCAFLFLEVNLWLPPNSNLISMAGVTLGKWGQGLAWATYLMLLYSAISAYIAGGGDLFHYILVSSGIPIPMSMAAILFTVLFGAVVFFGIRSVDYVNRGLMFGKMGALGLLILLILPFVSLTKLNAGQLSQLVSPGSVTVTALAFGSLLIIPSLRTYFEEDIAALRKAIFIGTLIPLLCYIAWDMVIMGVIPLDGSSGLISIMHSHNANSDLVASLTSTIQRDVTSTIFKFFTSICMATSFLSVSLSLSDFLSDGLAIEKQGLGKVVIIAATFMPPLFAVLYYPDAFLRGLQFAGVSVAILMILLPPLMVWRGRYRLAFNDGGTYQVRGGKMLLLFLLAFALITIAFGVKAIV